MTSINQASLVAALLVATISACSQVDRQVQRTAVSQDRPAAMPALYRLANEKAKGYGTRYIHIVNALPTEFLSSRYGKVRMQARADFARGEVVGAVYGLGSSHVATTRKFVDEIVAATPSKRLSGASLIIINSNYGREEANSIERHLGAKVILVELMEEA